jgi:hypothetical protein
VVQEVEAWEPRDPRPLQILMTKSEMEISGGEGDTIATLTRTTNPDRRACRKSPFRFPTRRQQANVSGEDHVTRCF